MSKGNGRNYYGFKEGKIFEVVKEGGRFYIAKFVEKLGLTAIGNPLKQFTLID